LKELEEQIRLDKIELNNEEKLYSKQNAPSFLKQSIKSNNIIASNLKFSTNESIISNGDLKGSKYKSYRLSIKDNPKKTSAKQKERNQVGNKL